MKISVYPILNFSHGVIWCRDLDGMADIDIRDEMNDQGVTAVSRIRIKDKEKKKKKKKKRQIFFSFRHFAIPIYQRISA